MFLLLNILFSFCQNSTLIAYYSILGQEHDWLYRYAVTNPTKSWKSSKILTQQWFFMIYPLMKIKLAEYRQLGGNNFTDLWIGKLFIDWGNKPIQWEYVVMVCSWTCVWNYFLAELLGTKVERSSRVVLSLWLRISEFKENISFCNMFF